MNRKTILIATCAVLTAIWGLQIARAQGASLAAGVYTEEQSKRGMELYKAQCASCHGDDLKGNEIINGKSILDLLTLGAVNGTTLCLRAIGDDAQAAVDALSALVESGFGEMPGQTPS